MNITVPSKTFLVGEYLALLDGPAILVNTQPRFENKFESLDNSNLPVSPKSSSNPVANSDNPLHIFWNENKKLLSKYNYNFIDPYEGKGGFGASSAQWAAIYTFVNQSHLPSPLTAIGLDIEMVDLLKTNFGFIKNFLEKYRSYSKAKFLPSGYDVISQWIGNIAYIDIKSKILKKLDWPFKELSFVLLKNNEKIPTHKHLKDLKQIPENEIKLAVEKSFKAFETCDETLLIEGIQENYKALKSANLIAPQSSEIIEKISQQEFVLAAKGCGALGADVFCFLIHTKDFLHFKNYIDENYANRNIHIIATEANLSSGIEIRSSSAPFGKSSQ